MDDSFLAGQQPRPSGEHYDDNFEQDFLGLYEVPSVNLGDASRRASDQQPEASNLSGHKILPGIQSPYKPCTQAELLVTFSKQSNGVKKLCMDVINYIRGLESGRYIPKHAHDAVEAKVMQEKNGSAID